jgi:WD40 repeat protein
MPPSEPSRVFISYARKDGAALAQRLQKDLKEQGFDAWLDTQRIVGGATWTTDIEHALDDAEFVLALMTSGSYVSEICRAEQLRALRKHKCVIPLMAQTGSDVPLHLEAKNYRDFTADTRYAQAFTELLADLHVRNGVALKPEFRETNYVTVPPLPVNFVERPEALAALRDALITDDGGRHIALTALEGMGGIGKTVLAQALCHDEVVQQAFPDGIVWITIGKESAFDALTRMREVGKALGDDLSRYENELAAKHQYRSTIRKKAALIVVDDVWRSSDLEPLRAEDSPRSRLLFTTRDTSIAAAMGAREHVADLLTEGQSREVLARWSRTEITHLPPIAAQLIHECGRLPLALSMVGAMLRGKPATYWKTVLEHLRNADLDKIKAQFPDYPYTDVLRAIQVSVDSLDETSRTRYLALAVLLEEMAAAPPVQQCLWGVDENQATETAEQFVSLSLAQRDQPEGSIRLHDLQLDYVRAQYPREDKEALDLIHGAIRLSANVIGSDPNQFTSQMVGRLLTYRDTPAIDEFTRRVAEGARTPWLKALRPTLYPPGSSLVRTLEGHSSFVYGVAFSGDGQRAVSASGDNTLKVWDVESGHELRTLIGHKESVTAVAVTPDGQRAVSASLDRTLKVWDLASGRELRTLTGHTERVRGAALSVDGRIAVSASYDNTLKVWDVESGRELRTLTGHGGSVNGVAVTADGQRAVSASFDKTLKVWDVERGRDLHTLRGHTDSVNGVALSRDGRLAVSASGDGTLKIWDVESGGQLRTLQGHSGAVEGVALTPDGQHAVSASYDQTLKVWDLGSGRELRTFAGHTGWVLAVAVTPDGQRAVSASADQTLKVWDLKSGRDLRTLQRHRAPVNGMAVSENGRLAVYASADRTLKVWEVESGRELRTLTGHSDQVRGVAVSGDGRLAVSASWDRTLKVWDVESGRELRTLKGYTMLRVWDLKSGHEMGTRQGSHIVHGVALSRDGRLVVSACDDDTLRVWEVESGRELCTLQGHSFAVFGVAVSGDGRLAVSASVDHTLKVWDVESGRELRTLTGHSGQVRGVAVSGDGRRAVSASADHTLKVWEVESGRELRTLQGHSGWVTSVAVSADGGRAVSASDDHTLKMWDLETGKVLTTFTCDADANCCAFSDALRLIVAGDDGGHVHFLRLEEPKPKS